MKVAAYQAPLLAVGSFNVVTHLQKQIAICEVTGVQILCCPEALLGGLADYAPNPRDIAIRVEDGELEARLAPLVSDTVTTIVGFTELSNDEQLFNSAAIYHRGNIVGLYRKNHPAMRKSVYAAGTESPVFEVDGLKFSILICNDSNFPDLASSSVKRGATILFIPSNNALPVARADVVRYARETDLRIATTNNVAVVRADVVGHADNRVSYGSSCIIAANGEVLQSGKALCEELLIAEITTSSGQHRAVR